MIEKILNTINVLYFLEINIFYICVIYYEYSEKYLETYSLVLSNTFIIPTTLELIKKIDNDKMKILDYIICILTYQSSSYYHLCDVYYSKYCSFLSYSYFQYLDFYFSYMLVSLCIQYHIKTSSIKHSIWIFISFLIQIVFVWYDIFNVLLNLSFTIFKVIYILYKLCKNRNKNDFYFNRKNINHGILLCLSVFLAILGKFYLPKYESYWWSHSYFWHIFIFLSSFFNYKLEI